MNSESLRTLIRDVLSEEIGRAKAQGLVPAAPGAAPRPKVREEVVSLRSDADLAQLVRRLAEVLKDPRSREEIEQGRWIFRLAGAPGGPPAAAGSPSPPLPAAGSPAAPSPQVARFEKGIVSERQIEALPEGTTRLVVGRAVRFTPLARDRLRMRGIAIERSG